MVLAGMQSLSEPSSKWKQIKFIESFRATRRGLWVFATWPHSIIQALTDKRLTEREQVYRIFSLPFDREYATISEAINGWIDKKEWTKIDAYLTEASKSEISISNKILNRIIEEAPRSAIKKKAEILKRKEARERKRKKARERKRGG